jgi:signal transduction histidine kinase
MKTHKLLKRMSTQQNNLFWSFMIFVIAISQYLEIWRAQIETVLPFFARVERTEATAAVLLIVLCTLMYRPTAVLLQKLQRCAGNALIAISMIVVLFQLSNVFLSHFWFTQLSDRAGVALPGVPTLETGFAMIVAVRLAGFRQDFAQPARFFIVLGLTLYGVIDLMMEDEHILQLTVGNGMGIATILTFAAVLWVVGVRQTRLILKNWQHYLAAPVAVLLLLSWFSNVPHPDNVLECLVVFGMFTLLVMGLTRVLQFGAENAALAHKNELQAKMIERQNADQSLLVSSLSHDLKAPIRNARTLITMREGYKQAKGMTDEAVDELLLKTLKRVEDLSRSFVHFIHSQSEPMDFTPVKVGQLIKGVAEQFKGRAAVQVVGLDQVEVSADPQALKRVVENMIENSIQHGQREDISLLFTGADKADGIEILFEDNGRGIAPEQRRKVFLPFETSEPKHVSGSSGLGLSIIKRLVERMNGTIAAECPRTLGGACFVIRIKKDQPPLRASV